MVGVIDGFRWALLRGEPALWWPSVLTSVVLTSVLCLSGSGISAGWRGPSRMSSEPEIRSQTSENQQETVRLNSAKEPDVYKMAYELAMRIFQLRRGFPPKEKFALSRQIRCSSRFVCLNLRRA